MFEDFRANESAHDYDADICIMGGGAAGITIARELAKGHYKVLLVESGDLDPDQDTIELNDGKVIGEPYPPLDTARLRYFGGSTNHWDGHCRPLDPIDFEARDWLPHSGWPITRKDLEPFFARANDVCELGPYQYDPEAWRPELGLMPFDKTKWVDRLWHYSPPTRFGQKYRDELKAAQNIHVLFNANVVDIVLNQSGSAVTQFELKALGGKEGTVRAKMFVVAGGGIENPRILLASNKQMSAGIGNANDLVGRFFLEHPHAQLAYAVPSFDLDKFKVYYGGVEATIPAGTAVIQSKPGLTEEYQRAHRIRNGTIDVGHGYDRSPGYLAFRDAARFVREGDMPDHIGRHLVTMADDLSGTLEGMYYKLRDHDVLWFATSVEQEPNPNSRVTLDTERDALGSPRAVLDWRLTADDKDAVRIYIRMLGEEMARLGLARMRIDQWLLDQGPEWSDLGVRYHHMGTTRMSDDPKTGVVDRDCRVHGIANLYIAGSSIFTTAGYANPTLTIVALALRLADHLEKQGTEADAG